jgi:REP element-mobilizing transposase RayT
MPDHFHALVQQTAEGDQISELMREFKHSTSRDFRLLFGAGHVKNEDTCRREEPEHVRNEDTCRRVKMEDTYRCEKLNWQRRFDDVPVLGTKIAWTKLKYIHANPVRRGLCETPEAYLWSSARAYYGNDTGLVRVATDIIGFEMP